MKPLSRLAAVAASLLVTVVALSSTAYAKLPPEPAHGIPPASGGPQPTVVVETGLSVLQVVGLMLLAAIAATVVTAIAGRRVPRISAGTA
jgi:hypothetical protein